MRTSTGASDGIQDGGGGALLFPLKSSSQAVKFGTFSRSIEVLLQSSDRSAPFMASFLSPS